MFEKNQKVELTRNVAGVEKGSTGKVTGEPGKSGETVGVKMDATGGTLFLNENDAQVIE